MALAEHIASLDETVTASVLLAMCPLRLVNGKVMVRKGGMEIQPWLGWIGNDLPAWWTAHNAVKHDRSQNYKDANLKNTLYALAGLFAALLIYLRQKGIKGVFPVPGLLRADEQLGSHCMMPYGPFISLQEP